MELTENKMEFDRTKLCILCNEVRKFKVITKKDGTKKLCSNTCLACISKKNNEKLKIRGYYKTYYQEHAEKMKLSDRERTKKKKELKNILLNLPIETPSNTPMETPSN